MKLLYIGSGAALAILTACAAPIEGPPTGTGGATATGAGGTGAGAGGAGQGAGGAGQGAGGTAPGAGGTAPGAGGTAPGAGGTAPGAGGTAPGAGGTAPGAGGGAATGSDCSAAAWTVTDNHFDDGTICGYAFAANYKADPPATFSPECASSDGSDCFMGTSLCASAEIPASSDEAPGYYPGLIIGLTFQDTGGTETPFDPTGTSGVTATFSLGGATGKTKINLKTTSGAEFCAMAPSSPATLSWGDFTESCWESGGTAFSGTAALEGIMLQLDGDSTGAQSVTAFCLDSVTVN